jgi:hypothetical protein
MYESAHGGVALRRLIAPMRVLETMMIPLRTSPDQSALMWADVYDDEPSWLDAALQEAGLPSGDSVLGHRI